MSLIEIMLQNKLIVISIGVSGLLLGLAVLLAVIFRVRAMLQARQVKRQPEAVAVVETPPLVPEAKAAPKPAPVAVTPTPEPEVSAALQSIIANAFMDDEMIARRNALLADLEPIDIHALNNLCGQVLEKLRTQSGVAA